MDRDLNYPQPMNEAVTAPPVGLLLGSEPTASALRGDDPFGGHRGPLTVTDDFSVLDDPVELRDFTEFKEIDGQMVAESVLLVQGMYCAACADTVECALQDVPGVRSARVHAATRRLMVQWDPQTTRISSLAHQVGQTGYRLLPLQQALSISERLKETRQALWRLFVAGFCAMQVMMYAWPAYVAEPGEMPADLEQLLRWASWVLSVPVGDLRQRTVLPWRLARLAAWARWAWIPRCPSASWWRFWPARQPPSIPPVHGGREVWFDSLTMFVFFPARRSLP